MRLLADMEVFVETAKLRNFGRAAAALRITPSTLSRRIAGLERELGFVLIRRSTRNLVVGQFALQVIELQWAKVQTDPLPETSLSRKSGRNFSNVPKD